MRREADTPCLEEDRRSEERTEFKCSCGENLTLSNRLNEDVLKFKRIMRGALRSQVVDAGGGDGQRRTVQTRGGACWPGSGSGYVERP